MGAMSYEAVVEKGTITIYSTNFFEKDVYWYGTCHADELDAENKLISKKIEREEERDFFDDFFGRGMLNNHFNESTAYEKEILFTEDSLTFAYDFGGMIVNQVTLYKENNKRPQNDSNAIGNGETETYEPYVIPRDETKPHNDSDENKKDDKQNEDIVLPEGDIFSL